MKNKIDTQNTEALKSSHELINNLKQEQTLSDLYQEIDTPVPPVKLDQQIQKAARQQNQHHSWWQQHKALAATAVIFSFVGMLSYQIWQEEQHNLPAKTDHTNPAYVPAPAMTAADNDNNITPVTLKKQQHSLLKEEAMPPAPAPTAVSGHYRAKAAFKSMRDNDARQLNFATEAPVAESVSSFQMPKVTVADQTPEALLTQIKHLITSGDFEQAAALLNQLQKNYPQQAVDPVILKQLAPYQLQDTVRDN